MKYRKLGKSGLSVSVFSFIEFPPIRVMYGIT